MKLLGVTNDVIVIASMSNYDYVAEQDLMADGGQIGLDNYAGYSRLRGKSVWFEIAPDFAELYNDYNDSCNNRSLRKYGVWNIEDVKILEESEWPDTDSFSWKAESAIWGHCGKSGLDKLQYKLIKNLETDHLLAILETQIISQEKREIIRFWLNCRKDELDKRGIKKV